MEQSASISNRASILCVVLFPGRLLRYKALQRLSANCRNRIHQMYDTCIHMPQWNWYSEYRMYYKYVQVCTFIHSVCVCVIHVMCRLQNIHHWGKPWAELKKATCNNNKKNSQKMWIHAVCDLDLSSKQWPENFLAGWDEIACQMHHLFAGFTLYIYTLYLQPGRCAVVFISSSDSIPVLFR